MKKIIMIGMLAILLMSDGCVSYLAKSSWNDAQKAKAIRVEADGSTVLVGFDISNMAYLKDNWPTALGAAVVDAGLLYGTYYLVDQINNNGDNSGNNQENPTNVGRDNTTVSITGDGNTVQVRGDESNTGTAPAATP